MVLKTYAESAAAAEGSRDTLSWSQGSSPPTAPRSIGDGVEVHDLVEEAGDADVLRGGGGNDREDLPGHHGDLQAADELILCRERPPRGTSP